MGIWIFGLLRMVRMRGFVCNVCNEEFLNEEV